MHICFNLDDKYIPYLKILIRNITDKTNEECTFHIIGINECDMQTNHKCIFYPNPDLSWFKEEYLNSYLGGLRKSTKERKAAKIKRNSLTVDAFHYIGTDQVCHQ